MDLFKWYALWVLCALVFDLKNTVQSLGYVNEKYGEQNGHYHAAVLLMLLLWPLTVLSRCVKFLLSPKEKAP